jgi:hypothetical protein
MLGGRLKHVKAMTPKDTCFPASLLSRGLNQLIKAENDSSRVFLLAELLAELEDDEDQNA